MYFSYRAVVREYVDVSGVDSIGDGRASVLISSQDDNTNMEHRTWNTYSSVNTVLGLHKHHQDHFFATHNPFPYTPQNTTKLPKISPLALTENVTRKPLCPSNHEINCANFRNNIRRGCTRGHRRINVLCVSTREVREVGRERGGWERASWREW